MKPRDFVFSGLLAGAVLGFVFGLYLGTPPRNPQVKIYHTREYSEQEEKDIEAFAKSFDPFMQVLHSVIIHGGGGCDCDFSSMVPPPEDNQRDGNNSIERDRDRND
jgi:hypothetical protein